MAKRKTRKEKERTAKRWEMLREMVRFGYGVLPNDVVEQAVRLYGEALKQYNGGDFEAAEKLINHVLQLSPKAIPALMLHAHLMMRLKRWDEAISSMSKVAEMNPNDADVHKQLGEALEATGQKRRALDAYRKAIDAASSGGHHPEWLEELQRRCEELERELSAERLKREQDEKQRQIEELLHLADLYESSGAKRRAREYLKSILELDPQNITVALRIAAIEVELGNYNEARELLFKIEKQCGKLPSEATALMEKLKQLE